MEIKFGKGKTEFGPGVQIVLTGNEVVLAIHAYLVAHNVFISGARTTFVNESLVNDGMIYVDPSGFVVSDGEEYSGRGDAEPTRTTTG